MKRYISVETVIQATIEEMSEAVFCAFRPGGCVTMHYRNCKKLCFLLGPSQGYITRTNWTNVDAKGTQCQEV
jgi:hypothetical protein